MYRQRNFLLFAAMTAAAALPAVAQTPSTVGSGGSETHSAAWIPDFSRVWTHPAFPWFEPPASGPGPITNLSRWAGRGSSGLGGSLALPAGKVGISDYDQLVGDYKNPILQPWAGGGQAIRRNIACRHYLSQRFKPVLAPSNAVHLQAGFDDDVPAAGPDHHGVRWER
jgi:hypothetical protein